MKFRLGSIHELRHDLFEILISAAAAAIIYFMFAANTYVLRIYHAVMQQNELILIQNDILNQNKRLLEHNERMLMEHDERRR